MSCRVQGAGFRIRSAGGGWGKGGGWLGEHSVLGCWAFVILGDVEGVWANIGFLQIGESGFTVLGSH